MIDVVFKFINFGVFAAFMWYMSKRYVLPQVRSKLTMLKASYERIVNDKARVRSELLAVQEKDEYQDILFQSLSQKVNQWRLVMEEKKVHAERLQEERKNEYEQLRQKQLQDYAKNEIAFQLIPQVLKEARTDLVEIFKDEARLMEYTTKTLNLLKD